MKFFNVDLSEFRTAESYKTIQALFTRKLEAPRKLSKGLISPADSKVIASGSIKKGLVLQIKGISYKVDDFLQEDSSHLEAGCYINFYLSPRDYHHFHAPEDMWIDEIIRIPGTLMPVSIPFIKRILVFPRNARAILKCRLASSNKQIYFVAVGAFNVGSITLNHEKSQPVLVKKGQDLGYFSFGSTVVILTEEKSCIFYKQVRNKAIRFGDSIGKIL